MRAIDLVIVIGWLAFWAYWLVEARNVKVGPNRWNRFVGIRVAVIVLIVFLVRFVGFGPRKATENWALAGIGLAVWAAGLALAVWARLYIRSKVLEICLKVPEVPLPRPCETAMEKPLTCANVLGGGQRSLGNPRSERNLVDGAFPRPAQKKADFVSADITRNRV